MKLYMENKPWFGALQYLKDTEKQEFAVIHFEDDHEETLKELDLFSLTKMRLRNYLLAT